MSQAADLIATYLRAKDGNRPHLMAAVFAESAVLEMVVKSGTISFPARSVGPAAIEDVLVRRFGQTFENVYTLCLSVPPVATHAFQCDWLVCMSEKANASVRVGCGTYDWQFGGAEPCRVERLVITIEQMEVLPATALPAVMQWVSSLPYPWCSPQEAGASAPDLAPATVLAFLRRPWT